MIEGAGWEVPQSLQEMSASAWMSAFGGVQWMSDEGKDGCYGEMLRREQLALWASSSMMVFDREWRDDGC